jgi:hypothetical protein
VVTAERHYPGEHSAAGVGEQARSVLGSQFIQDRNGQFGRVSEVAFGHESFGQVQPKDGWISNHVQRVGGQGFLKG